jgi:hypothetical protein
MAEREILGVYTALRDQALGFGSAEIKAPPVVDGGRVLGVVMDLGYDTAVVSIVGLADGTASMYISNGGGMIGLGDNPPVAAAAKRWVAVAEEAASGLEERGGDSLPAEGEVRFNVLTTALPLTGEALENELAAGSHRLSPLYAAGQDLIGEIRAVDEARQKDT